ncbi:alpha/beta hydrolase [Paeniglutamicibacter antarcticus]
MFEAFSSDEVQRITIPDPVLSSVHGSMWLSSWWLATAVTILCVLLAGFLLSFRCPLARDRSTHGRRNGSKACFRSGTTSRIAGVMVLALIAGAFIVNSAGDFVPDLTTARRIMSAAAGQGSQPGPPADTAPSGQGTVSVVSMPADENLQIPAADAWVYTPPGYDATGKTRYPVVYLIHGYPGTASDWFTYGKTGDTMDNLVHKRLVVPMIVVSLDISRAAKYDTECLDSSDGPKVESWLYSRAVPHIDKLFLTQANREGRILAGFSAGGFCALDQGLRHQETWGTIIAFEGFGEPGSGGEDAFGDNEAEIKAHSPEEYIPTMKFVHHQAFYLDSGEGDGLERVKGLAEQLKQRQQKVYYRVNAGEGHSWSEVRAGLPYALLFASEELRGQQH